MVYFPPNVVLLDYRLSVVQNTNDSFNNTVKDYSLNL